jgi:hypothetical protein
MDPTPPATATSEYETWRWTPRDDDQMETRGRCLVAAFDRCRITVYGDCQITAYDDCEVTVISGPAAGPPATPGPYPSAPPEPPHIPDSAV